MGFLLKACLISSFVIKFYEGEMNLESWLNMDSSFPLALGWLSELKKKTEVLKIFSVDKPYWIWNIYIYSYIIFSWVLQCCLLCRSVLGKHVGLASDKSVLAWTTRLNFEAMLVILFIYLFLSWIRETLSSLLPGQVGAEGIFQQRKAGDQPGAVTSVRAAALRKLCPGLRCAGTTWNFTERSVA